MQANQGQVNGGNRENRERSNKIERRETAIKIIRERLKNLEEQVNAAVRDKNTQNAVNSNMVTCYRS